MPSSSCFGGRVHSATPVRGPIYPCDRPSPMVSSAMDPRFSIPLPYRCQISFQHCHSVRRRVTPRPSLLPIGPTVSRCSLKLRNSDPFDGIVNQVCLSNIGSRGQGYEWPRNHSSRVSTETRGIPGISRQIEELCLSLFCVADVSRDEFEKGSRSVLMDAFDSVQKCC